MHDHSPLATKLHDSLFNQFLKYYRQDYVYQKFMLDNDNLRDSFESMKALLKLEIKRWK